MKDYMTHNSTDQEGVTLSLFVVSHVCRNVFIQVSCSSEERQMEVFYFRYFEPR